MAELRIRNVDPAMVEKLKKLAKKNGITMEKQLLTMINEKLVFNKKAFFAELRKDLEQQRKDNGGVPYDSTPGIRAERDAM